MAHRLLPLLPPLVPLQLPALVPPPRPLGPLLVKPAAANAAQAARKAHLPRSWPKHCSKYGSTLSPGGEAVGIILAAFSFWGQPKAGILVRNFR